MSFEPAKAEEDLRSHDLTHNLQIISDILKKKYERKRKSWFGSEHEKKLGKKAGNLNYGNASEGQIREIDKKEK